MNEAPWKGDKFEYIIDGIALEAGPQGVLQKSCERGQSGWEVVSTWPTPSPAKEGAFCIAVMFKRKLSALILSLLVLATVGCQHTRRYETPELGPVGWSRR